MYDCLEVVALSRVRTLYQHEELSEKLLVEVIFKNCLREIVIENYAEENLVYELNVRP